MTDQSVAGANGDFLTECLRASQLLTFGQFERVDQALGEAIRLATRDEDVAAAAMARASVRFWHLADVAAAHRVLDTALARMGDCPAAEDLEAQRGVLWLFSGRTARALVVSRNVRRRGRGTRPAMLLSASMEAMARGLRSEVAAVEPMTTRGAHDDEDALQQGFCALAHTFAHVVNGLVLAPGGTVPGVAPVHGQWMRAASEGLALLLDGLGDLWAGRVRSAGARMEEAVTHLRRSDRAHLLPAAFGGVAYSVALRGDAAGAARAVEDAEEVRHPVARFGDFFVDRGRAWAEAAGGELTAARDRLAGAARDCVHRGQPALAAQAWHDVARLGDAPRAAAPLAGLAARPGAHDVLVLLADHAVALATGDAAAVGEAAQRFRVRGHHLLAAEAAAQAAVLYGPGRDGARRWREVSDALVAGCEGARTPALGTLHDLDLTPREREIVGLAAQGLTNPDIARRLHVSVRTVGNHLHAAYVKLGVHRREELAALHPFGVER